VGQAEEEVAKVKVNPAKDLASMISAPGKEAEHHSKQVLNCIKYNLGAKS